MATNGRKPKPTRLKVLEGNPGRRPLPTNEPKPRPEAPRCPAWMPKEAKRKWKELAPELERLGLLTAVDGPAFAICLVHFAMAVEAASIIKQDGLLTVDDEHKAADGTPALRKHPAHQLLRDNSAAFRHWMAEFGLTPASRVRLAIPEVDDDDEMAQFLKAGR